MIYFWEDPENATNRETGEYDRECSPDRFLLFKGRRLGAEEFSSKPVVEFELSQKRIGRSDCLNTNAGSPLVNQRVKALLEKIAPGQVQFFPAECRCKDGLLEGYEFLNITQTIIGIDHEKSIYKKSNTSNLILFIKYLTYKEGCLGEYLIARDKESISIILVSEKLKEVFEAERITGVRFLQPEKYSTAGY